METKQKRRLKRKIRVKSKIFGTMERPRLSVFKSNVHIYGQLVDDLTEKTIIAASDLKFKSGKKSESAFKVGEELAKLASAKKIKKVIFDRNGFSYHGRVRALAEGARKGGLDF